MDNRLNNKWLCIELPVLEYTETRALQTRLVSGIKDGTISTNVVLMLEHYPVFTLGRRGVLKNLTVTEDVLRNAGIPLIHVERGGDITFHGPGQLILYPLIDLRAQKISVTNYVEQLEEVMILTAGQWGIRACRKKINRGIWVENNKIGSIGIAIRHGISFHGLALNVNCSLRHFDWMHPCGLQGVGVTSMKKELSRKVSMREIREAVKIHFEDVFGVELVMTSVKGIEDAPTEASMVEEGSSLGSDIRESQVAPG